MTSQHLHVKENGGVFYVEFLDLKILSEMTVVEIYAELKTLVDVHKSRKFVLQLGKTRFITKTFFDRLLSLEKLMKNLDQAAFVRLCPLRPEIAYAMGMLGISKHFVFCTEAETRRAISILAPSIAAA